jgi:uncharacterized membrane protein YphA (DoxX/SURF4 family)
MDKTEDRVVVGTFVVLGIATTLAAVITIAYCTYAFLTGVC